jgi:hypothetical protein
LGVPQDSPQFWPLDSSRNSSSSSSSVIGTA